MIKLYKLISLVLYCIQYGRSANYTVCYKSCEVTRIENVDYQSNFYYGMEYGKECIIDPQRCNTQITIPGYFNTCKYCNITSYIDHVLYGWEDNRECVIDLDYCNMSYGNNEKNSTSDVCKFCYFKKFEKQEYFGIENGKECRLNMNFCTGSSGYSHSQTCNWCEPLISVTFIEDGKGKDAQFIAQDSNNKKCILDLKKCGLLNMNNYNENKKICTYCVVIGKNKDNNYIGRENFNECIIDETNCKVQINNYNSLIKYINSSPKTLYLNKNSILSFLIFITLVITIF